jgi:hypothetical protein
MVNILKVTKGVHPVELTCDEQGVRIEGDFNASHKRKHFKPKKKQLFNLFYRQSENRLFAAVYL